MDCLAAATAGSQWQLSPFHHGENGEWRRFANADADDSTMALWLSLLYRVYGPPEGMSPDLQQSLRNARKALLRLRLPVACFITPVGQSWAI
jgi:hypothetical protein